ncbi:tetratricopeptide repeat protein [Colwellia hornerae]|uniref:Sel1 repeat family protein n=1 Tax=Colwellia hornerae TaxID=89402 RepID=A0A5C6Q6V8_9GAMM|nr:tetratricopeptide repeat protein [Colwellia hornerae]TWX49213.1 sel1 repeat family protein [Colwellia hornerae]TWX55640.1 sel1 repeat family protein [Colwellia hornerae]TWX64656.1 sel1 repeat family protein [Colwellia hornerae]
MRFLLLILTLLCFISHASYGQKLEAVQIYTDNQLLGLIKENKHLGQVVLDECQLVQDIEARATKSEYPSYQFLWGDMLAYGVCVKKDVPLGLHFMKNAADQALPEALEQLGRYYHTGKFMQVDVEKAIFYLREAAAVNNLKAQMRLADIYAQGYGSPLDYPELYAQLHHSVTDDKKIHQQITKILSALADKMPEHVVNSAKEGKF